MDAVERVLMVNRTAGAGRRRLLVLEDQVEEYRERGYRREVDLKAEPEDTSKRSIPANLPTDEDDTGELGGGSP